ncbi:hypothetical protein FE845_08075 [Marinobacter sp. 1-4A]|uniref:hypothetical protein n=1 Tax=Marinobacter sp. 1-4A TaxID=2582919 RepID=UPI001907C534|nr:hypothetical protein [Marinobacter sp. 1-4A]MBK1851296.1 hypothetical protein [Marinobacter sp. 1-4A]
MRIILVFIASIIFSGCQSMVGAAQPKQLEIYSQVSCTVKKTMFGSFNKPIKIEKDFSKIEVDGDYIPCTNIRKSRCLATKQIPDGYKFYSISAYTYEYPGSGFLDYVEIINGMITDTDYVLMECNRT